MSRDAEPDAGAGAGTGGGPGTGPGAGPATRSGRGTGAGAGTVRRTGPAPRPGGAPKQDRSRATRQRLLAAAVDCLAEHGWAGSTVAVVAERAGVSRGAAQHHFPTREDLFTAAVEHVAEQRSAALRALARDLPPAGSAARTRTVVAELVDLYTGPLFRAALQLWVAASNEPQLGDRVVDLEARVGRETHRMAVQLLGADESVPGVRETVQGLLDLGRGLGLAHLLTDDTARRARIVAQWARLLDEALPPAPGARPAGP
ncbi:TetR/AcrR family transcriptional regulator [Streptomyces pactum]|uniref:TetR/AcrR family transcriptional regulator n=1 Tax=Streptomyces pactum TaxID=68249 RepID=A0ABS0NMJ9_9ACTN|nr:TetR/AcrR family transcriptional regulator [Streptomyces pactum]MBH5336412.1 TetR/AcrR family transcriptional regulator [Streptomyces pactum]